MKDEMMTLRAVIMSTREFLKRKFERNLFNFCLDKIELKY